MTLVPLHHAPPAAHSAAHGVDLTRRYSGRQAAAVVGLSWERFRKVRTDWTRDRDFPAEINEPGEAVHYLADAVDAWLIRRTRRVHAGATALPRQIEAPAIEATHAARAGRDRLRQIKGTPSC